MGEGAKRRADVRLARWAVVVPRGLRRAQRPGGEARGAAHRALEPHHLLDPIETAERRFQLRDRVESAQPEGLISLLGTKIGADLAFELQLSRDPRQLAEVINRVPAMAVGA